VKTAVQQRARELGFDGCRITDAAPPATSSHFQQWLTGRRHGEMSYLERNAHKRVDPQKVLAGAKSIISLAVPYSSDEPQAGIPHSEFRIPNSMGLVARYARFADYHKVIGEKLQSLAAFVSELGGAGTQSLWYVDTGPLLERDLAQRAGLGFIGKHTNLISRRLGNWIFLSEIITTLALDPDEPERNHCGSCSRCLAACPTAAITAPFQLDARRCISYLTIELKGPIPLELRPAIGNRIYGCDDCLAVCPWNRFAKEGGMMAAHARPDLAAPDLLELLALDDAGFSRRFHGTPILRVKRRGLLRNVCVALGNIADASALPALDRAGQDPDALIAEHARWATEQIIARTPVATS
jgi:epoxyqueuosine reductase